jgi:hypothetical protein
MRETLLAGKTIYTLRSLNTPGQLAALQERSKRLGRVDETVLMARTVEMGVVEPRLRLDDVMRLMETEPDTVAQLAVRIIELTTG